MSEHEVITVADAAFRHAGYNIGDYRRSAPRFNNKSNVWIVFYDKQSDRGGATDGAAHIFIPIEDATGKPGVGFHR
jgi:hypothetical protein